MSFEWDENKTVEFLLAYKKYPCLWNPRDRKYYKCCEKNAAFQNILEDVNIPGLTIADCVKQIGVIKEIYKQEQLRTIQDLQCQNLYCSPYVWYNLISGMLMKVIEEEKEYCDESLRSSSVEYQLEEKRVPMQTKSASYGASTKKRKIKSPERKSKGRLSLQKNSISKENRSTEKEGKTLQNQKKIYGFNKKTYSTNDESLMSQDHYEESSRLKRNSKSNKTAGKFEPVTEMQKRFSVNSRQDSIGKRNSEENYLECPSCGWEDPSSFNDEENVRDEICCSYYASVFQKVMEKYKAIQQITGSRLQQQQQQCNNPVCSPSYFGDAPNRSRNDRKNVQNEHVEKIEWNDNKRSCSCTQTEEKAEKADKKTECNEEDCSKATALKIAPCNKGTIGVTPEIISKFEDGVLEAYSQFKVVLPKLVQAGEELAEKRSKNVQTCSNTKQQAVSTLKCLCLSKHIQCPSKHLLIDQKCDCKFQNTVSLSTTDLNLLLRTCLPCSLMHNVQRNAEINQCTQDAPKTYCAPCEAFKLFAERHNEEIQLNGAKIKVDKSNSCPRFHQDTVESSFVQCDNRNLGKNTVCIPPKDFVDIDKNPDSFVLLTPSGKFVPFVRRQTEAKEVLVPCENYKNAANDNVEMEEEHAAHGGVCTNVNEIGKGSPIITQVLLHCLDKMISLEKKTLAKSNRSEEKFCKPCKSGQKVFNTPESSLEALGCICSEEMEVERTTGILTKTFLEVVKRALDLDNKADSPLDCACNEGAYEIDFATVMNEIEKSAAKILTMATGLDLNLLLNQNQLETNQDKAKTVHNKATFVQPENQDVGTNSNSLQRLFMKEATAQSNYNVVYDGRTQTDPKIIRESGILAKPDKTSFGTQKREPILVQVVNYKGKEKFKKPDKNLLIQDDLVRTPMQTAKTLKNIDLTEAKNWGNCCNKNLRVKCDNNCKDPHAYRKDSEKQMLSCQTFLNKNSKIPLCVGLHKYLSKNKDH